MTSFEIASIFSIEDRATEPLLAIAGGMDRIVGAGEAALAMLGRLDGISMLGAVGQIDALASSFDAISRAATEFSTAAAGIGGVTAGAAREAAEAIDTIAAAWHRASDAQSSFRHGAASQPVEMAPGMRHAGPIIDGELAYVGALNNPAAIGYDGPQEPGYGAPMVMQRGFGRGSSGTESPYMGGFRNPYTGPESGPAINVGDGNEFREEDESLRIPTPPGGWGPGSPPDGGRGNPGGGRGSAGSGRGRGFQLGMTQFIEGAAVYEAMHAGMSEEASLVATMERGFHLDSTDPKNTDLLAQLRAAAHQAVQGTSFTEAEGASGMATLAAPLGQRGRKGVETFLPVFETAAKISEAAKQLGIGSYEDTLAGAVEYAHQTGTYEPAELNRRLNDIFAITEALPETNVHEQARIMSYVVPEATALGVDPTEAARGVGFLERAGLRGTRAATTLRQFMLGNMKTGGPLTAHMEHSAHELAHALSLSPEGAESLHHMTGSEHIQALKGLGIIDARGHNVTEGADGNYDLDAGFTAIEGAAKRMPRAKFGMAMYNAYGVRGEDADLLAERPELFAQWRSDVSARSATNPLGTASAQEQLAHISQTTQQITGQAGARLNDVLNTLATSIMGEVRPTMSALAHGLAGLNDSMIGHPHVAAVAADALLVGAGASMFSGLSFLTGPARRGIADLFSKGGAAPELGGAIPEVAEGGGILAGLGGSALRLAGRLFEPLAMVEFGKNQLHHDLNDKTGILNPVGLWNTLSQDYKSGDLLGFHPFGGTAAAGSPGGLPAKPGTAGAAPGAGAIAQQIHVNVGPITLTGVGADIGPMVEKLFHQLADKLARSLAHSSSTGFGSLSSQFTLGNSP